MAERPPLHLIGGTVSGLGASKSVVLRLNGAIDFAVGANGPFTFPRPLVDGSPYSVTVATQPAGQSCGVFNGSGTLDDFDISSVVVTCTDVSGNGTYTIGGSVSGLTVGTTLVLRNNGADDLTLLLGNTTSGTFTFATPLQNGASYAVTVQTQPLGQTCDVTNGTGSVPGANVTSVIVTCSPTGNPTYTIGGTVSGLGSGKAVVLQNNGGNDLTVLATGGFTFTSALASGVDYSVTVLTQPVDQSCVVTNEIGTVAGANVTNVTVTCTNTPSLTVGGNVTGLGAGRSVVLRNNGGNSTAVGATGPFTFSGLLADETGYAVTVHTQPAGQDCVVTNGSGTLAGSDVTNVLVTCSNVPAFAGGLDPTYGGGAGFTVHNSAAGGAATDITQGIALDGSGRVLLAGYSVDANGIFNMALWRYTAAGVLDTNFNSVGFVTHAGTGSSGFAQTVGAWVGVDGNGKVVVTGWSNDSGGVWGVAVWRYNDDGTPDTTLNTSGFARITGASGFSNGVVGAIDASNRIVVTGYTWNGSDLDMGLWRFNADGTPDTSFNGTGEVSHGDAAGGGGDHQDIGAAMRIDGSGNLVVVGYSTNGSGDQDMTVWRYLPNGTLDTSFAGTGYFTHHNAAGGGGNDVGNALTLDGSGRILVTGWSPSFAGGDDLAVWRLTSAGALDATFNGTGYLVHDGGGGSSNREEGRGIALDSTGRIVVVGMGTTTAGNTDAVVWRFTTAGALDAAFAGSGFAHYDGYASADDSARAVVIDSSGNIVVAGLSKNTAVPGATGAWDAVSWRIYP